MGTNYVNAWYLHHAIDHLRETILSKAFERLEERPGVPVHHLNGSPFCIYQQHASVGFLPHPWLF